MLVNVPHQSNQGAVLEYSVVRQAYFAKATDRSTFLINMVFCAIIAIVNIVIIAHSEGKKCFFFLVLIRQFGV